jgi:hypothetical protein
MGFFGATATFSTGASSKPSDIAVADVNGDGKLDLLTANAGEGTVGVLLNTTVYAPTLTSVSPNSGPVGTSVTLTGSSLSGGLSGGVAVSFGGTAATTFKLVNATTITATVPAGATSGNDAVVPGGLSRYPVVTAGTAAARPHPQHRSHAHPSRRHAEPQRQPDQ